MKGLESIPAVRELTEAYRKIQDPANLPSVSELSLWTQWSRFDPRLGEQWIAIISRDWKKISPLELGSALKGLPWPAAAGVLLGQACEFIDHGEAREGFRRWKDCVLWEIAPATGELFFVGIHALGGEAARKDAELTLEVYSDWGYLGREIMINKAAASGKTLLSAPVRKRYLDLLVGRRSSFTTQDYIAELGGLVSVRQAELDLVQYRGVRGLSLEAQGNTRARRYRIRGRK